MMQLRVTPTATYSLHFLHRRLWTKASRLMLQLTRSAVEDSAGIIFKPPPQSRMLSRTDREPNERLGR